MDSLAVLEAQASALKSCVAWVRLDAHAKDLASAHLRMLLDEPERFATFSRRAGPVILDFSRQRMVPETLQLLVRLAEERSLKSRGVALHAASAPLFRIPAAAGDGK